MSIPQSYLDNADTGPLFLKDVEGFRLPTPEAPNKQISEFLEKRCRERTLYRISRVNKNYPEWSKVWPDGEPIDFYTALLNLQDNIYEIERYLVNPEVQKRIKKVTRPFSASINQRKVSLTHETPSNSPIIDLSPEILMHDKKREAMPDISKWPARFLKTVISCFQEGFTLEEIGEKTRLSPEQLTFAKKELISQNLLVKKKKKTKSIEKIQPTGITFVKGNRKYRFGLFIVDKYDPELNPLNGYYDDLSGLPLKRPMICSLGYVLDYETWYKYVFEYKKHPFSMQPMRSLHPLVELTLENFTEYKDRIRNIELK